MIDVQSQPACWHTCRCKITMSNIVILSYLALTTRHILLHRYDAIGCVILWRHTHFSRLKYENRWNGVQIILRTPKRVQNTYDVFWMNLPTFAYMRFWYSTDLPRDDIGCFKTMRYIYIYTNIQIYYIYILS